MTIKFNEDKQQQKLEELRESEEESLAQVMSQKYGLPYIDLGVTPINIDALRIVKEEEARETEVAPFNIINKKVSLAIVSPNNDKTNALVEKLKRPRLYCFPFYNFPPK